VALLRKGTDLLTELENEEEVAGALCGCPLQHLRWLELLETFDRIHNANILEDSRKFVADMGVRMSRPAGQSTNHNTHDNTHTDYSKL